MKVLSNELPYLGEGPTIQWSNVPDGAALYGMAPIGVPWHAVKKCGRVKPDGNCPRSEYALTHACVKGQWYEVSTMKTFRFKPNKTKCNDGCVIDRPSNGECADAAYEALDALMDHSGVPDYAVETMLVSLFHLCDRDHLDVDEVIERARNQWMNER